MRVLYINEYQGSAVVAQRGHKRNRALGAARKVELFATSLMRAGHDVQIVSTGAVSEGTFRRYAAVDVVEPPSGARVHYLPGLDVPRANMFYARRHLRRYLGRAQPADAVLLYNIEWLYLQPVLEFVAKHRAALIIEYEDDALEPIDGSRFAGWHRSRGAKAVRAIRPVARGVVAVSDELAAQLAIADTIVVPGAVGDDLLSISETRRVDAGAFRLVYAGSLTRAKGVHELVSAVEKMESVALEIVGNGPELEALRSRASERVIVHGEIRRADLMNVYRRSHAAVNPHIMSDEMIGGIFPFKIAEYVAAGLPVISTRLGSRPAPIASAIVEASSSEPGALASAIVEARDRYASLIGCTEAGRRWVEQEYSEIALSRKLDLLLHQARGKTR